MNDKQQLTTVTVNNLQIEKGQKNTLPGGSLMALSAVGNAALGNQAASHAAHQAQRQGVEQGYYFSFDDQGVYYQGFFYSAPLTEGEQIEVVSRPILVAGPKAVASLNNQVHTVLAIRKAAQHSLWVAPNYEGGYGNKTTIDLLKISFWVSSILIPACLVPMSLAALLVPWLDSTPWSEFWAEFWTDFPFLLVLLTVLLCIPALAAIIFFSFYVFLREGKKANQVYDLLGFTKQDELILEDLHTDYIKAWEARQQQPFPEPEDPHQFFYLPEHLKHPEP